MKKDFKYVLLLAGFLVGTYHLWLTVKAVFVFRIHEPISLWTFVFTGPLSTLPASITAFFKPKIGGTWLIGGSVVSFLAALATVAPEGDFTALIGFLKTYSAPILVLGVATFLLEVRLAQQQS